MARDICIDRVKQRANHHASEASYFQKIDNRWEKTSWAEYHELVRKFGKSLIALDIEPKSKVAILGYGRLEWVASCIGSQYVGAVSVGIYTTSSLEEVAYVVDHSDAEVLVVENNQRYLNQVKPIIAKLPKLKKIVIMTGASDEEAISFKQFLSLGNNISDSQIDQRHAEVNPLSTATMIYTSGTTGNPKAVMLSHQSLAWTVRSAIQMWKCGSWDSNIAYLPLAHVAEQMFSVYGPIECGMQTYFATSMDNFKEELKEVSPTIFFGVPRVFEKIYGGIKEGISQQKALKQAILKYLAKINHAVFAKRYKGDNPGLLLSSQYLLGRRLIFTKLKQKIGFCRVRICLSGAAPISKDILNFFLGLDIPIYEVYGLSENSGPSSINIAGHARIGSVGRPLTGSEIKINHDGEICIKGPHVFSGYYKDEAASKEALKDGWLLTGDIGTIDNDGFLYVTDRKKDLLITSGGKNIAPQNLESMLKTLPYVQSAVVVGDKRNYLCALLSPDKEKIEKKAIELGISKKDYQKLISHHDIHEAIRKELANLNARLAPVEQIKKYSLLNNEFSIDTGEYTPTMKVKRKFVNEKYRDEIEKLYQ